MNLNTPTYCTFKVIKNALQEREIDVFEVEQTLNFNIKRVYFLYTSDKDLVRGNHAHKNQKQVLFRLKGGAKVKLTNHEGTEHLFVLENKPLFIPENHWIELSMEKDTQIMCLAEQSYQDLQTITNKLVFLNGQ